MGAAYAGVAARRARRRAIAALVRRCVVFVLGWWLLQALLLGTGAIALGRVVHQLAEERQDALAAMITPALASPGGRGAVARLGFDRAAAAVLGADTDLVSVLWLDNWGNLRRYLGDPGSDPAAIAFSHPYPVEGGSLMLVAARDASGVANAQLWRRLAAVAAALPVLWLPVVLWLRPRLGADWGWLWRLVNSMPGMATSVVLLVAMAAIAHDNAAIKDVARTEIAQALAPIAALSADETRAEITPDDPPAWAGMLTTLPLSPQTLAPKAMAMVAAARPQVTPVVVRGVKNIAVLIVAAAVLCAVLAGAGSGPKAPLGALSLPDRVISDPAQSAMVGLNALRPIYFLAVLAENLCAPFLPGLLRDAAHAAALPPVVASSLFMAYFIAFTAMLLPSGWLVGRVGAGRLIWAGAGLLAAGLAIPSTSLAVGPLLAARVLAGAGQGMLLIGVQSLVLTLATGRQRTMGAGIIVFGFNGGMIGGNAFGSLLVDRWGPQAVFALAALAAFGVALLAWMALAGLAAARPQVRSGPSGGVHGTSGHAYVRDGAFLATTLGIGIPTKAVLTGVVLYALPLILGRRGFSLEEVGQIAMFYAAGVLAVTAWLGRAGGWRPPSAALLGLGALVSAVAMIVVPLLDWTGLAATSWQGPLLVTAVLFLGLAHGCINAPVITHVADLPVSAKAGPVRVAATYRLLERLGHVGGPLVVERVISLAGGDGPALAVIAAVVALAALAFAAQGRAGARALRYTKSR